jgi:SOS response regulatory protein OraA/RecX
MTNQLLQIRAKAIDILSRREHSRLELRQNLLAKNFPTELI